LEQFILHITRYGSAVYWLNFSVKTGQRNHSPHYLVGLVCKKHEPKARRWQAEMNTHTEENMVVVE